MLRFYVGLIWLAIGLSTKLLEPQLGIVLRIIGMEQSSEARFGTLPICRQSLPDLLPRCNLMGSMTKSILSDIKEFLEQEIEPSPRGFGVGPIARCLTKQSSRGAQILAHKNGLSGFKLRMELRVLFGSKPTAAFLSGILLLRMRNGTMSQ